MEQCHAFSADITAALETLRRGGLILYPTDTVWGIGCDAANADAVARVYALKRRDDSKALITLVADRPMLQKTVGEIPDCITEILDAAQRPTTVIYPQAVGVAENLVAPDGSLAVRMVDSGLAGELCRGFGAPIVSTSANISGASTPESFAEISREILDGVDYVCTTGREDRCNAPSTIIMPLPDGSIHYIRR